MTAAVAVVATIMTVAPIAVLMTAVAPSAIVAVIIAFAVSGFIGVAMRTARNRDRIAMTAAQFITGRARRGRQRNAFAVLELIAMPAMRRRNRLAMTADELVAGRTFGAVLVVAGASAITSSEVTAAGQRHRAAGAQDEESSCNESRQA